MFDLRSFRKDNKMSQKQLSEIIGIGTSFISQIETGKDPMPGYIPDKLAEVYGTEILEKYHLEEAPFDMGYRKRYYFPANQNFMARDMIGGYGEALVPPGFREAAVAEKKTPGDRIDRLLDALERRDELAILQQREHEKQGDRLDILIALLKDEKL